MRLNRVAHFSLSECELCAAIARCTIREVWARPQSATLMSLGQPRLMHVQSHANMTCVCARISMPIFAPVCLRALLGPGFGPRVGIRGPESKRVARTQHGRRGNESR